MFFCQYSRYSFDLRETHCAPVWLAPEKQIRSKDPIAPFFSNSKYVVGFTIACIAPARNKLVKKIMKIF